MALTVASRQHGIQHPHWPHSSPPTSMLPHSFPSHTASPHFMLPSLAQMHISTPSPAPSASSKTSNSTLSSIPAHNNRELTREMLVAVLDYFSTLLPSRFEDHPVRLVVHGGACMLLHPDLDRLAAQTPPFLRLPAGFDAYYNMIQQAQSQPPFSLFAVSQTPPAPGSSTSPSISGGNDNATTRPPTPPPDVKRTTTRDVDIITRSFDSEWRQIGITNATDLLKECIALTAKKFGLGLDWMNSDPDVALPMAYDPTSNTTYDPIHTDALKFNNIASHTVYNSPNGLLQLISVTPVWAVALKLVRFTKSDPGDICLILRNGTNLSGTKWTEELVESWLVNHCWPMGYRDYDPVKLCQLRAKIKYVVAMVKEHERVPKREKDRTPTPTRSPRHHPATQPIYPYQVPLTYSGFAHNIPASPRVGSSLPQPPPPSKGSPQSRTSNFLPRSIAEWGNASIPAPLPVPVPSPAVAGQGRDGRAQLSRRTTEPVIPFLEADARDRGRSRSAERRTQTWPLVGSLLARGEDKDERGERNTREKKEQKEGREGRDKENRTKQKVVDWLKSNNRRQREEKNDDSDDEGGDESPVIPLLLRPPSRTQLRASPPRDLQDAHTAPVIPMITVADTTGTRSTPSEESDTLTITEENVTPWHPYHQRAHQRTPVVPEIPHAQHQQQQDTHSWIRTTQPRSSTHSPPSRSPNKGEEEVFVPPLPTKNTNDGDDSDSSSDGLENNSLLLSFTPNVGGTSPSSPLATARIPPGFMPYHAGAPNSTMPVIPHTMSTMPGMVAPTSPTSFPGYLGNPGSGFAGY